MKGRSEWDRQVTNLKRLAEAYGTTFPLPDGATVRRMNDKETAAAAEAVATAAERFKDDLDKASTLAETRPGGRQEGRRGADQASRCRQVAHQRRQARDR